MKVLLAEELVQVNGGDNIVTDIIDGYYAVRDFVNEHVEDFVNGVKDGWNSK